MVLSAFVTSLSPSPVRSHQSPVCSPSPFRSNQSPVRFPSPFRSQLGDSRNLFRCKVSHGNRSYRHHSLPSRIVVLTSIAPSLVALSPPGLSWSFFNPPVSLWSFFSPTVVLLVPLCALS
ncbi:uncharacterized protein DS421_7g208780 [Arachis hypogaea]|nr:uncharacterized protein DS421_7g208780 [Arachis hypogaea]